MHNPFALVIGSVFFFLMLFKWNTFFLSLSVLFFIILDALYLLIFNFFSRYFFASIAIYLWHSHYNFNVIRVGYGKAIQMVMQAEWLACFWCISNQDQVLSLPGYDDIILKYFPSLIILFIHWLYLWCFLLFYLHDTCDSS